MSSACAANGERVAADDISRLEKRQAGAWGAALRTNASAESRAPMMKEITRIEACGGVMERDVMVPGTASPTRANQQLTIPNAVLIKRRGGMRDLGLRSTALIRVRHHDPATSVLSIIEIRSIRIRIIRMVCAARARTHAQLGPAHD